MDRLAGKSGEGAAVVDRRWWEGHTKLIPGVLVRTITVDPGHWAHGQTAFPSARSRLLTWSTKKKAGGGGGGGGED